MNKPRLKDVNYLLCGLAASRKCLKDICIDSNMILMPSLSPPLYMMSRP